VVYHWESDRVWRKRKKRKEKFNKILLQGRKKHAYTARGTEKHSWKKVEDKNSPPQFSNGRPLTFTEVVKTANRTNSLSQDYSYPDDYNPFTKRPLDSKPFKFLNMASFCHFRVFMRVNLTIPKCQRPRVQSAHGASTCDSALDLFWWPFQLPSNKIELLSCVCSWCVYFFYITGNSVNINHNDSFNCAVINERTNDRTNK